jgi:hypothetical protein
MTILHQSKMLLPIAFPGSPKAPHDAWSCETRNDDADTNSLVSTIALTLGVLDPEDVFGSQVPVSWRIVELRCETECL